MRERERETDGRIRNIEVKKKKKNEKKGIKINGERDYNGTIRGADIMRYLKLDY